MKFHLRIILYKSHFCPQPDTIAEKNFTLVYALEPTVAVRCVCGKVQVRIANGEDSVQDFWSLSSLLRGSGRDILSISNSIIASGQVHWPNGEYALRGFITWLSISFCVQIWGWGCERKMQCTYRYEMREGGGGVVWLWIYGFVCSQKVITILPLK